MNIWKIFQTKSIKEFRDLDLVYSKKTNMDNNDEAFPSINPFFVDNVQCCYVERSKECSSCLFMKN